MNSTFLPGIPRGANDRIYEATQAPIVSRQVCRAEAREAAKMLRKLDMIAARKCSRLVIPVRAPFVATGRVYSVATEAGQLMGTSRAAVAGRKSAAAAERAKARVAKANKSASGGKGAAR